MAACAWYFLICVPIVCQPFSSAAWNLHLQQLFMVACPAFALGVVCHDVPSLLSYEARAEGLQHRSATSCPFLLRGNLAQAFFYSSILLLRGPTLCYNS